MSDNSFSALKVRLQKNRFLKYGLPFVVLMVAGSFGLEKFTVLRYQYRRKEDLSIEEAEKKYGTKVRKREESVTLESVYNEIQEKGAENWQNIRGPRPWENSKHIQDELRKGVKE